MSYATHQMLLVTMVPLKHWPKQTQHLCVKVLSFARSGFYCSPIYKPAADELKDQDSQNSRVLRPTTPRLLLIPPENRTWSILKPCKSFRCACICASIAMILHWCGCWSQGGGEARGLTCPGRSTGGGNVTLTDSFLWAELSCDRWVMVQRTSTQHANKCASALRSE